MVISQIERSIPQLQPRSVTSQMTKTWGKRIWIRFLATGQDCPKRVNLLQLDSPSFTPPLFSRTLSSHQNMHQIQSSYGHAASLSSSLSCHSRCRYALSEQLLELIPILPRRSNMCLASRLSEPRRRLLVLSHSTRALYKIEKSRKPAEKTTLV